jgi:methyl-accepting chemotaxis protein
MQQLSARSEEATRSLAATTDAAQTLSDSIVSNAERLREADVLAKRTSDAAGRGAAVARDSTAAMKAIETSSAKVTDIADVIDEIAFQTNMLALNAAVEAARAGEAGRGFSVVATEVRALSQRVAASAADIKQLLDRSNAEVRRGVDLAREAGTALAEIESGLTQSVALIAGIADGGRAQEQGVATMTAALDSLSEITHRNADMAQGAAEAIQQMSALADRLDAGVSFFHGEPEGMDLLGADGGMTADDLPPWPADGEASLAFDPSDWTDASDGAAGDLPPWQETELDRSLAAFDMDAEMEAMIREAEKSAR